MNIAFCFLLTYSFPLEEVWVNFFKNIDDDRSYYIIIHGKTSSLNFSTDFFKQSKNVHVIKDPLTTKWGDISLVHAQNKMLHYATQILDADFCCLCSGNCLPIKSFDYMYKHIMETLPTSRFLIIKNYHPILKYKQSQWCILSLEHIQIILKYSNEYTQYLEKIRFTSIHDIYGAPDEFFYVNLLHWRNIDNYLSNGCTYTKWNYVLHYGHPKEYHRISRDKLLRLENSPYFFFRKVMRDCIIDDENVYKTTQTILSYFPNQTPQKFIQEIELHNITR